MNRVLIGQMRPVQPSYWLSLSPHMTETTCRDWVYNSASLSVPINSRETHPCLTPRHQALLLVNEALIPASYWSSLKVAHIIVHMGCDSHDVHTLIYLDSLEGITILNSVTCIMFLIITRALSSQIINQDTVRFCEAFGSTWAVSGVPGIPSPGLTSWQDSRDQGPRKQVNRINMQAVKWLNTFQLLGVDVSVSISWHWGLDWDYNWKLTTSVSAN